MASNFKAEEIIDKILNSGVFKFSMGRAGRISKSAGSLLKLLKTVLEKTNALGKGAIFDEIREKVFLLAKLVKAYIKGEYKELQTKNIILIVAGFLYLISPLDFIPDFLPFVGFSDDIALLIYIVNLLSEEITRFEDWEKTGIVESEK